LIAESSETIDLSDLVVPAVVLKKTREFLLSKKCGQIIYNIKDGKIMGIDIRETVRVSS